MQQERSKMLGTMPMGPLVTKVSVPIMISMLVQALYNVVDGIFVARYSPDALTAVSLAFPIQILMIAVATGLGVGINSLISRKLGQKRPEEARDAARCGMLLELCGFVIFLLFGLLGSRSFFHIFTPDPELQRMAGEYLAIVTIFSFGLFLSISFERMMQATGNTILSMTTQATGAIINIILDPIMIFGLFGFPRMEVAGAALATVTGQIVAAILGLFFNLKKNPDLHLSVRGFRPSRTIIGGIYSVGIPSIVMQSIGSVMVFGMNQILIAFTQTATAVFGVYFKLQSFIFMPVFGLNNGMVPIVADNYGARQPARIMKTIRLSVCYAVGIMLVGLLIFQFASPALLRLFQSGESASGDLLRIGVPALRIISYSFLFAGYCIVATAVFQALGHGVLSLVVSVVRQLFVLLPVAFLLSRVGGLDWVWWAFPIAELVAVVLCTVFLKHVYHKEIAPPAGEREAA